MDRFAFTVFLVGVTVCAVLGFGTSMTFSWPGYLILGFSALLTVSMWFRKSDSAAAARTAPSTLCLAAGLGLAGYVMLRGSFSPVAYLARDRVQSKPTRPDRPPRGRVTRSLNEVFIGHWQQFAWRLYALALSLGLERAGRVVLLADGAEWMDDMHREFFPNAIRILERARARNAHAA